LCVGGVGNAMDAYIVITDGIYNSIYIVCVYTQTPVQGV